MMHTFTSGVDMGWDNRRPLFHSELENSWEGRDRILSCYAITCHSRVMQNYLLIIWYQHLYKRSSTQIFLLSPKTTKRSKGKDTEDRIFHFTKIFKFIGLKLFIKSFFCVCLIYIGSVFIIQLSFSFFFQF